MMSKMSEEDSGRASLVRGLRVACLGSLEVIGASRSNLVPDEEVGLWPEWPVTGNSELRLQLRSALPALAKEWFIEI